MVQALFIVVLLGNNFPTISRETQVELICKSYVMGMLTSQLTTLGLTKLLAFHIKGIFLWYTIYEGMVQDPLTILFLKNPFPMICRVTQMQIIYKSYTLENLKCQITTLRFTKLFAFHLIESCEGYTIFEIMVYSILIFFLLCDTIPTISQLTQTKIICKSYAPEKLTYQLTTSGFPKLLAFHHLRSCLGYTIFEGMVQALFNIVFLGGTF